WAVERGSAETVPDSAGHARSGVEDPRRDAGCGCSPLCVCRTLQLLSADFLALLRSRANAATVGLDNGVADRLAAYASLLDKWNRRINLTALSVSPPTVEAVDRLFVEPLAAIPHFPSSATHWVDLGSGAGSPAIPIAIALGHGVTHLTMVEAKARKAAFLREAVRMAGLANATVVTARFEDVALESPESFEVATVRAVDLGAAAAAAYPLLKPDGLLLAFRPDARAVELPGFARRATVP